MSNFTSWRCWAAEPLNEDLQIPVEQHQSNLTIYHRVLPHEGRKKGRCPQKLNWTDCGKHYAKWYRKYQIGMRTYLSVYRSHRLFRLRKMIQNDNCSRFECYGLTGRLRVCHNSEETSRVESVKLYIIAYKYTAWKRYSEKAPEIQGEKIFNLGALEKCHLYFLKCILWYAVRKVNIHFFKKCNGKKSIRNTAKKC